MKSAHLQTPEVRAKIAAARAANVTNTRNVVSPGSEGTTLVPGNPVRIARHVEPHRYAGRTGWVATINTEHYDNGCPDYTEVGVTFHIVKDWARAAADAWFRVDEVVPA